MKLSDKLKLWRFSGTRLEAFSDAVFAIVLTLLVLELKMPHVHEPANTHEIIKGLVSVAPVFFSWIISFLFVAIMWLHHHQIMHMSTGSDYGTIWINFFLLFFICLLPFPTALLGEYCMQPLIVAIWGLTVSLTSLMLVWFYSYQVNHFLSESFDQKQAKKNVRLSLCAGPLIYLMAAVLAWVSVYISFVLYALIPFLYIFPLDKEKPNRGTNASIE